MIRSKTFKGITEADVLDEKLFRFFLDNNIKKSDIISVSVSATDNSDYLLACTVIYEKNEVWEKEYIEGKKANK